MLTGTNKTNEMIVIIKFLEMKIFNLQANSYDHVH